jgi:hypothetical protein
MRWRGLALPRGIGHRLLGNRVQRGGYPAALASRLLRCRLRRGTTGVRFPPCGPVARSVLRSLGFPWGGSRLQW